MKKNIIEMAKLSKPRTDDIRDGYRKTGIINVTLDQK